MRLEQVVGIYLALVWSMFFYILIWLPFVSISAPLQPIEYARFNWISELGPTVSHTSYNFFSVCSTNKQGRFFKQQERRHQSVHCLRSAVHDYQNPKPKKLYGRTKLVLNQFGPLRSIIACFLSLSAKASWNLPPFEISCIWL